MATVLIVEDDGLVAGRMVQLLRKADHTPVQAPDARSALREALDRPDLILLDLRLPDLPGEEILRQLKSEPRTAAIPVLVITGCQEAARDLKGAQRDQVADVLLKPVSGSRLCQAVDQALSTRPETDRIAYRLTQHRQRELVRRLIVEGPDRLAFHVYRRLCADRSQSAGAAPATEVLTWSQIGEWARLEGLLDEEQARLIQEMETAERERVAERSV
ncbi:MAG TPA: response regulator [Candidatus Sulfotelmatobacter sp.]|nr:response regulator [Candidatus Sulfotelmatobacter sp.]